MAQRLEYFKKKKNTPRMCNWKLMISVIDLLVTLSASQKKEEIGKKNMMFKQCEIETFLNLQSLLGVNLGR